MTLLPPPPSPLQSSPNNMGGMNNPPGTPRDDGEMGGNFLNPFQNESVSGAIDQHLTTLTGYRHRGYPSGGLPVRVNLDGYPQWLPLTGLPLPLTGLPLAVPLNGYP